MVREGRSAMPETKFQRGPETKLQRIARRACVVLTWGFAEWLGISAIRDISIAYGNACTHYQGGMGCGQLGVQTQLLSISVFITAVALAALMNWSMRRWYPKEASIPP
jgi:hypothetical protein